MELSFGQRQTSQRVVRTLAVLALLYAVTVLAYVSSCPDIRVRCLLADDRHAPGMMISATPDLEDRQLPVPQEGDVLTSLSGRRVDNFLQFARATVRPRGATLDAGAVLSPRADPLADLPPSSPLWQILWRDTRRVHARYNFETEGGRQEQVAWLQLQSFPTGRMTLTLAWLAVQIGFFLFAAVIHWRRPNDIAGTAFLALCSVSLVSLVGGSYWWVIASSSLLAIPFLVASCLMPAGMVHFVSVFPRPSTTPGRAQVKKLALLYAPAVVASLMFVVLAVAGWCLTPWEPASQQYEGFAGSEFVEAMRGRLGDAVMTTLRGGVYVYAGVAAIYFLLALVLLSASARRAQLESERRQLRLMQWAGVISVAPIGYALWLATSDQSRLALGQAQVALYGTSFLIALAYAVGLVRARPTFLDEAAEQGFRYTMLSVGTTLLFSVVVALAFLLAVSPDLPWYGSSVLTMVTMTISVLLAWWLRERVQRSIDRRFYRERFRLDRAVQGIYSAADESLEPDALGEKALQSCRDALGVDAAAIYVREGDQFAITVRAPEWTGPATLRANERAIARFDEGTLLQRAPGLRNDVQDLLRGANAEALQPVIGRGGVVGMIVLGSRQDKQAFSAEDATFLAALGPMVGVAMESVRIHQNIARLNEELRVRLDRIDEQQREIKLLESELADLREREAEAVLSAETGHRIPAVRSSGVRGSSLAIREVMATARKVAASEASVLVRGESGTGKELLARAIHEASPRANGPLVTLHCAALTSSLLESELFGHVKGAFTDARSDREGRFEQASGGTLFLDEVGDIPLDVQVKLLRVLQERVVERVGSTESRPVDVRLVAATHQNLEMLIQQGRFREDLLYRINVVELRLPPLRDRGDDVVELAQDFLATTSANGGHAAERFAEDAVDVLRGYDWPGNVRQLQNVVARAVVLSEGPVVRAADLPPEVLAGSGQRARRGVTGRIRVWSEFPSDSATERLGISRDAVPVGPGSMLTTREAEFAAERRKLEEALLLNSGNKAAAARSLGMPRSTFFSKLKKHGVTVPTKPR